MGCYILIALRPLCRFPNRQQISAQAKSIVWRTVTSIQGLFTSRSLRLAELRRRTITLQSIIDPITGVEERFVRVTFPATIGDGIQRLSLSSSKSNDTAPAVARINAPPEVWAGPLNHLSQITHLNDSLRRDWGRTQSLTWNNEGFRVQGRLIYPKDYDPHKNTPCFCGSRVARPTGCCLTGLCRLRATILRLHGDLRDLVAGVDVVTKKMPTDPNRIGITAVGAMAAL